MCVGGFWVECVLGGLSALVFVLTLVWSDWIELVFGFDPDHGNGSFEWLIVGLTGLLALSFVATARAEWRLRA